MANFSYTITEGEHKGATIWSGRYCAVLAMVVVRKSVEMVGNKHFLLVSKRGSGTPNYQGCWNIQCGFLEDDEDGAQACARETFEECGVSIPSETFKFHSVNTDPSIDKNVTVRYIALLDDFPKHNKGYKGNGGEDNEVDEVMWLDLDDSELINKLSWAFNHKEIVVNLSTIIKRIKI